MTYIPLFALLLSAFACSSDEPAPDNGQTGTEVDETLTCKSPQDTGEYATFYKPRNGWVGDAMPFYDKASATYYLFYLQDWRDGRINDHPIYYTTTQDFGTYRGFYEAVPTGTNETDLDVFIGTGSFVEKDGIYYAFYTGHNGRLTPREQIMLATSTDLKTWTKQPTFTFRAPAGYDQNNFRDPHVYHDPHRRCYVMLVTTLMGGKGCLARYTSADLLTWTNIEPLTDFESDAEILECPDMFEMGGKWYLTFSRINRDRHRKTFYRVASSPEGPWRVVRDAEGHHETFDGLFLYAGKTASDGTNRYLTGWCSTDMRVNNNNELGWAGAMVTHRLVQQPSGRLYPVVPQAVTDKMKTVVPHKDLLSKGTVSGADADFTLGTDSHVVFNRNASSFKLTMSIDAGQATRFGIALGACDAQQDVYKLEFNLGDTHYGGAALFMMHGTDELNYTPLTVPANKRFDVTLIAEKTICTLYVNGQVAFTNRIFKMHQNPWMIYSTAGTAHFSNIKVFK